MIDVSELSKFQKRIEKAEKDMDKVFRTSVAHAGEEFKKTVVPLTPVYSPDPPYHAYEGGSPRVGGTLRNAWKVKRPYKKGSVYNVTVENAARSSNGHLYASDVEYGHKQHKGAVFPVYVNGKLEYRVHKKGYVKGIHFMAIAQERAFKGRAVAEYTRKKVEECLQEI